MTSEILTQLNSIKTDHIAKKIFQDQEKAKTNKYTQIKKTKDYNGVDYSVDEYVREKGGIGFDIVFYSEIDGTEYKKIVSFGEEAEARQRDWFEVIKYI